jgi:hypothetical protein
MSTGGGLDRGDTAILLCRAGNLESSRADGIAMN